jgi:flagellar transcriptional activator FlhD
MSHPNFQSEIRELNIAYLMLAQKMLRSDRETAMFRLGIDKGLADFIENLSATKLVKIANNPVLVPRFRFDDEQIVRLMAGEGRDETASILHAAIIAANRSIGEVV